VKLDIFNHIFPRKFYDRMLKVAPGGKDMHKRVRNIPCIVDLGERFRIMDRFGEDYAQVISLPSPPIEEYGPPPLSTDLARLANDGLAELVRKYPKRFPAFVASLPMNDPAGMLKEARRAIKELGAAGVQVFTNVLGKPLTAPATLPLFDLMARLDRPIWLHPARGAETPDYRAEPRSHYEIWWTFGWPYETSAAMARMVFSGMLDRLPNLKVLAHHMGAMVPYFEGRVGPGMDQLGKRTSDEDLTQVLKRLKRRPFDYFKDFYADTAVFGSRAATVCGLDFYAPDRVLFASDSPFDPERGPGYIRDTIKVLESIEMPQDRREQICFRNAQKLFRLS
jgi:aminocarboxymuconate-semialdehyde decarboxylase